MINLPDFHWFFTQTAFDKEKLFSFFERLDAVAGILNFSLINYRLIAKWSAVLNEKSVLIKKLHDLIDDILILIDFSVKYWIYISLTHQEMTCVMMFQSTFI